MEDVTVTTGQLGGRGVVAARDFACGETVMSYQLRPLSLDDYLALDPAEAMFVHSYHGRRYLYPEPARYVNHSDAPSCRPDFATLSNVALRDIRRGEPITIDEMEETRHELATFLVAFGEALTDPLDERVLELIHPDAECSAEGQRHRGSVAVALAARRGWPGDASSASWIVGTGRWEALGSLQPSRPDRAAHTTVLLALTQGTWRVTYLHIG